MVKDSQFPFEPGEEVDLQINSSNHTLIVFGDHYKGKRIDGEVER